MKNEDARAVPCDSCTACCRNTAPIGVWPERGDDLAFYMKRGMVEPTTVELDGRPATEYALRRDDNGDCAFLGESGCTIYDHRPYQCRTFDCRAFYAALSRTQRRRRLRSGELNAEVMARGKQLRRDSD